ncbi:MAG: hypothetical protein ACYS0D_10360 [Planctomycetota bacterium]
MIAAPGQATPKQVMPVTGPTKWEEKPRVFRRGFIPEGKMPKPHTKERVELIYNTLKGLIMLGHNPKRPNKAKMNAGFREIREINPALYDRVRTYYDRLTEKQIRFFIGPRPKFHDDGALAIWDHNRDNPVLQAVLKEEKPTDVNIETLAPKSKLALPRRLGGIL